MPHPYHIPSFTGAFRENLDALISTLIIGDKRPSGKKIGFELERILLYADGAPVPFSGARGVSALLHEMARDRPEEQLDHIDGSLLGLAYPVETSAGMVDITVSLEPAAQLEISTGPAHSVRALYETVQAFDRQVESALGTLGIDAHLVALGCNPSVGSPLDLELIPKKRYTYMDAYLCRRGRFAHDMMRCTASTQVSLDYESESDAERMYRMATLLGPVFSFLFDNAPIFRGQPAFGMARSRIWRHVDVDRCGIVPGALKGLSFEDYILWVSSVKPVIFTDEQRVTTSTGDLYSRDIMSERLLSRNELLHLLSTVYPNVRLKGFMELREMDSLPPRLAAACTSFTGALFYDRELESKLVSRLQVRLPGGFDDIDENDAVVARVHLEEQGWDASAYGVPVGEMADALLAIATENVAGSAGCLDAPPDAVVPVVCDTGAARDFDLEGLRMLERLWGTRRLPRDCDRLELQDLMGTEDVWFDASRLARSV